MDALEWKIIIFIVFAPLFISDELSSDIDIAFTKNFIMIFDGCKERIFVNQVRRLEESVQY